MLETKAPGSILTSLRTAVNGKQRHHPFRMWCTCSIKESSRLVRQSSQVGEQEALQVMAHPHPVVFEVLRDRPKGVDAGVLDLDVGVGAESN